MIKEYDSILTTHTLPNEGEIEYENWTHPLNPTTLPGKSNTIFKQQYIDLLRTFVFAGDLVIDIGAHMGDSTIPMALAAGKYGMTLALEPNPYVFKILEKNSKLNTQKTNIRPLNCAAGEKEGKISFGYSDNAFCNGGFLHHHAATLEVKEINTKEFLEQHCKQWIDRLSFIKIDTEGYEHIILKNMASLIDKRRPVIRFEVYQNATKEHREYLYDLLIGELNYVGFLFDDREEKMVGSWNRDSRGVYKPTYDVMAFPKERKFRWI